MQLLKKQPLKKAQRIFWILNKIAFFGLQFFLLFFITRFLRQNLPGHALEIGFDGNNLFGAAVTENSLQRSFSIWMNFKETLKLFCSYLRFDFGLSDLRGISLNVVLIDRVATSFKLAFFGLLCAFSLSFSLVYLIKYFRLPLSSVKKAMHFILCIPYLWWLPLAYSWIAQFESTHLFSITAMGLSLLGFWVLQFIHVIETPILDCSWIFKSLGQTPTKILWRHQLRPHLRTFVAILMMQFGHIWVSAWITESVFRIYGISTFFIESLYRRDERSIDALLFIQIGIILFFYKLALIVQPTYKDEAVS